MGVLAIDLGTTTGWALRTSGATISDSMNLSGGRYEGGGMRFLRFRSWLTEVHSRTPLKLVVYEEVRAHKGTAAAHIYGGLQAVLTSFLEEHGVPYEGIPVGTIKKFIAGSGNAGKPAVMAAVRDLGFSPKDDNEADAIALLMLALERPEVQYLA